MNLNDPIFIDEARAREHLEQMRWPEGPACPHCGAVDHATKLQGEKHRKGVYQCNACREQFTVTVGTPFERSKVPLNKWLLATYLLSVSDTGMSTRRLHRILRVTYKTAWSMARRIREGLSPAADRTLPDALFASTAGNCDELDLPSGRGGSERKP